MSNIPKNTELFDTCHTIAKDLFDEGEPPYTIISNLKNYIKELSEKLDNSFTEIAEGVFIAKDAQVAQNAVIMPPAIIGHRTNVRHGAFIRGSVIVGDDAVIGNSTEVKNSLIFDSAELPHYNYIGDSIIGYHGHLGAGAIASNLRLDGRNVKILGKDTGLRKLGVILGDYAEVGCNAVLCPGTVIGKRSLIYPLSVAKGVIPPGVIFDGKKITERKN